MSFSPLIQGPSGEEMWVKPGFQELWRLACLSASLRSHGGPRGKSDSQELLGEPEHGSEEGISPVSAFGWVLGAFLSPEFAQEGLCLCLELALLWNPGEITAPLHNGPYDLVPASHSQEWIKDLPITQAWLFS